LSLTGTQHGCINAYAAPKWLTDIRDVFLEMIRRDAALTPGRNLWLRPLLEDDRRLAQMLNALNSMMRSDSFALAFEPAQRKLALSPRQPGRAVPDLTSEDMRAYEPVRPMAVDKRFAAFDRPPAPAQSLVLIDRVARAGVTLKRTTDAAAAPKAAVTPGILERPLRASMRTRVNPWAFMTAECRRNTRCVETRGSLPPASDLSLATDAVPAAEVGAREPISSGERERLPTAPKTARREACERAIRALLGHDAEPAAVLPDLEAKRVALGETLVQAQLSLALASAHACTDAGAQTS